MVRVLHCDDSAAFRALIRAELEDDADIEIVGEAPTVDAAVGVAGETRPDVVLLDLLDVERDAGGELQTVAPDVRVVVLSGHPREYGERRRGGAAAYVEKDAPITELREAVLRAAGGKDRAASPDGRTTRPRRVRAQARLRRHARAGGRCRRRRG